MKTPAGTNVGLIQTESIDQILGNIDAGYRELFWKARLGKLLELARCTLPDSFEIKSDMAKEYSAKLIDFLSISKMFPLKDGKGEILVKSGSLVCIRVPTPDRVPVPRVFVFHGILRGSNNGFLSFDWNIHLCKSRAVISKRTLLTLINNGAIAGIAPRVVLGEDVAKNLPAVDEDINITYRKTCCEAIFSVQII